jgi:GTP-binding protein
VEGREFICIDTGGIDGTEDGVETRMAEQSLLAIEEADVVLFMVDARAGLMPADSAIAKHLRSREKPLSWWRTKLTASMPIRRLPISGRWVWVRSTRSRHRMAVASPACWKPFCPWVDEVNPPEEVDEDAEYWAQFEDGKKGEEEEPEDDFNPQDLPIKLAIVGRPNVGKSTLTNRILGEERVVVYDMPGTTRDSIYIPMQRDEREYVLIDTAGVRKRGKSPMWWKNSPLSKPCRRLKMPTSCCWLSMRERDLRSGSLAAGLYPQQWALTGYRGQQMGWPEQ